MTQQGLASTEKQIRKYLFGVISRVKAWEVGYESSRTGRKDVLKMNFSIGVSMYNE